MTVSRDGPLVLGHPIEGGFHEMTPPLGAPRRGTAYDDCLLENLRGAASDVAATAIISACRTRHPADVRYDVTVEVRQGGSPALLLALNASEVREVVALIARVLAGLEPEIETAAERIVADRLRGAEDDLQVAVASARAVEAKRLEKRPLRMAAGAERRGVADGGAALDAGRGHRLAHARLDSAARSDSVPRSQRCGRCWRSVMPNCATRASRSRS